MKKTLLITLLAILLTSCWYLFFSKNSENNKSIPSTTSALELSNLKNVGSYEVYLPEKISLSENKKIILFFHAGWCPTCRALDKNINKNLTKIPDDVVILKVDYDKESELKKKYNVTIQHTLVVVDSNGNIIKKWSGGLTIDTIISQL